MISGFGYHKTPRRRARLGGHIDYVISGIQPFRPLYLKLSGRKLFDLYISRIARVARVFLSNHAGRVWLSRSLFERREIDVVVAVLFGAEEKLSRVLWVRFEDRRKGSLPFVVGLVRDGDDLLVLAAGVVNVEKLTAFGVFIDAVDDKAAAIRRPHHPAKAADAFALWQFDLKRRVAAAVGRRDVKFLIGPTASNARRLNKFVQVIGDKQSLLF